jgi:hypothetical protein
MYVVLMVYIYGQFSKITCTKLITLKINILLHPSFVVLYNTILYAFAHQNRVT